MKTLNKKDRLMKCIYSQSVYTVVEKKRRYNRSII